jgi:hypothetical protein
MVLVILILVQVAPEVLAEADFGTVVQGVQEIPHLHHHHRDIKVAQEPRYQVLQIMEPGVAAVQDYMLLTVPLMEAVTEASGFHQVLAGLQHTMQVAVAVVPE